MATPSPGKFALVKIGTASSETDISANCDSCEWPIEFNNEDTTSFGSTTDETSIPTTQKSEIKLSGNWDATLEGVLRALVGVAGKSLIYAPLGNHPTDASGTPRRTAPGYLKDYSGAKADAKGKLTWEGTFVKSGATTFDTVP